MKKATFGLIGAGGIAQSQHIPNLLRAPHAALKIICDVDQQKIGPETSRQFRDVRHQGIVGPAVFKGDQDFFIHGGRDALAERGRGGVASGRDHDTGRLRRTEPPSHGDSQGF